MKILGAITYVLSFMIMNDNVGTYTYQSHKFKANLELKGNNQFFYNEKNEYYNFSVNGSYFIKGDTLILNSIPQRDRLIVYEKYNKNRKLVFDVKNKLDKYPLGYYLYIIAENDSIIELSDQWDKSKLDYIKIKAFYIIDNKGLKSPLYYVKGCHSNYFEVLFEPTRVFENEVWLINENHEIIHKGLDNDYRKFTLKKKNANEGSCVRISNT